MASTVAIQASMDLAASGLAPLEPCFQSGSLPKPRSGGINPPGATPKPKSQVLVAKLRSAETSSGGDERVCGKNYWRLPSAFIPVPSPGTPGEG